LRSVTSADGGAATGNPAVSDWVVGEFAAIAAAPAAETLKAVLVSGTSAPATARRR
jgi:hypothetical protein